MTTVAATTLFLLYSCCWEAQLVRARDAVDEEALSHIVLSTQQVTRPISHWGTGLESSVIKYLIACEVVTRLGPRDLERHPGPLEGGGGSGGSEEPGRRKLPYGAPKTLFWSFFGGVGGALGSPFTSGAKPYCDGPGTAQKIAENCYHLQLITCTFPAK